MGVTIYTLEIRDEFDNDTHLEGVYYDVNDVRADLYDYYSGECEIVKTHDIRDSGLECIYEIKYWDKNPDGSIKHCKDVATVRDFYLHNSQQITLVDYKKLIKYEKLLTRGLIVVITQLICIILLWIAFWI